MGCTGTVCALEESTTLDTSAASCGTAVRVAEYCTMCCAVWLLPCSAVVKLPTGLVVVIPDTDTVLTCTLILILMKINVTFLLFFIFFNNIFYSCDANAHGGCHGGAGYAYLSRIRIISRIEIHECMSS